MHGPASFTMTGKTAILLGNNLIAFILYLVSDTFYKFNDKYGGIGLNIDLIYRVLLEEMDSRQLIKEAPMHEYTSFKAGGKAALLVVPQDIAQLQYTMNVIAWIGR